MMPDEKPFTPEAVDEQIDRLAQMPHLPAEAAPSTLEQHVVGDLQTLFSADTQDIARAALLGREQLAERGAALGVSEPPHRHASNPVRLFPERQTPLQPLLNLFPQKQRQLSHLSSLVAGVLLVVLVGSLVAGLVLVRLSGTSSAPGGSSSLKGGLELVFQATCDIPAKHCTSQVLALLPGIIPILKGRIKDGLDVAQPVVHQQGSDQIVVDLPPQVLTRDALALLTPTGRLEILDTGPIALQVGTVVTPGQYPVRVTGSQLDPNSIQAILDQQSGRPVISFQVKSQYQTAFATYTQQNIGNFLTVTLDGKVIESAQIQSQITGQGEIYSSGYTLADAQEAAAVIRYGSEPVLFTIVKEQTITT